MMGQHARSEALFFNRSRTNPKLMCFSGGLHTNARLPLSPIRFCPAAALPPCLLRTSYHGLPLLQNVSSRNWGNVMAILNGDFLLASASEIAAELGAKEARILGTTFRHLCTGQMASSTFCPYLSSSPSIPRAKSSNASALSPIRQA
jgi:hypothetical protein